MKSDQFIMVGVFLGMIKPSLIGIKRDLQGLLHLFLVTNLYNKDPWLQGLLYALIVFSVSIIHPPCFMECHKFSC